MSSPMSLKNQLEEEFRQQVKICRALIARLPSTNDRKKAYNWLHRTLDLKSPVPLAKKNRNDFLSFFLNVVRDALFESALRNCRGIYLSQKAKLKLKEEIRLLGTTDNQPTFILDQVMMKRGPKFMARWSKDRRTYVAMQPLVGSGALVYMAVSSDGWTTNQYKQQPEDDQTIGASSSQPPLP